VGGVRKKEGQKEGALLLHETMSPGGGTVDTSRVKGRPEEEGRIRLRGGGKTGSGGPGNKIKKIGAASARNGESWG